MIPKVSPSPSEESRLRERYPRSSNIPTSHKRKPRCLLHARPSGGSRGCQPTSLSIPPSPGQCPDLASPERRQLVSSEHRRLIEAATQDIPPVFGRCNKPHAVNLSRTPIRPA